MIRVVTNCFQLAPIVYLLKHGVKTAFLLSLSGICSTSPPLCTDCSHSMELIKISDKTDDGFRFQCPAHKDITTSIRINSILYEKEVPLSSFILITYFWAMQIPISLVTTMADVSEEIAVSWYRFFRNICTKWIEENPIRIGGINQIVQIDETAIARKSRDGGLVPTKWLFGGVDVETKKCFLIRISDRSRKKLMNLIETFVEAGSRIRSFEDTDYSDVASLSVKPAYTYETMSHRANFVDPTHGVRPRNIENLWTRLKIKFVKMGGDISDSIDSYLDEYMWRQVKGKIPLDAYNGILADIAHFYPL